MAAKSTVRSKPRTRKVKRGEREQQMLRVAERVFAEQGYHATSMDDLAARVGITKPMLYNYFGSKEGLLVASIRRVREELLERTMRAVGEGGSAEEMLRRAVRVFFEFIDEHGHAWKILREELGITAGRAAREIEAIRGQQVDLMTAAFAAQTGRATPIRQLEVFAQLLLGACERLALWRERNPGLSATEATQALMSLFWPGLSSMLASRRAS
jgi:AcrR family transcriptional regulator